jgi:hypothetical protein
MYKTFLLDYSPGKSGSLNKVGALQSSEARRSGNTAPGE